MKNIKVLLLALLYFACNSKQNIKAHVHTKNYQESLKHKAESCYSDKDYFMTINYLDTLLYKDSSKGEYFFLRGKAYSKLIKRKNAIIDYKKSIKLKYRISDSYFNMALNYVYENDSLALYYFQKALPENPYPGDVLHEIDECKKRLSK